MNNLSENIKLALEGLYANKMRALLTMLGIIIGIASVITIISIGDALSSSMNESLSALGGNNVSIYLAGKTNDGTYTLSEDDYFTDEMLTRFNQHFSDRIKDVELTTNLGSGTLQNVLPKQDMKITGVNGGYATVESQKLTKGRSVTARDVDGGKNVIVISSILSRQVFGNNTNPVGKKMSIETQYGIQSFYVIGVYKDPKEENQSMVSSMFTGSNNSQSAAYIPYTTANTISGTTTKGYANFMVKLADNVDSEQFVKDVSSFFSPYYQGKNSKVYVESMDSVMSEVNGTMSIMSMGVAVIAGISLLVGGIGVMNIMLVSVTERTREIGIRKALGAPNSAIQVQFIVESIIICVIGGIIGVILGAVFNSIAAIFMKTSVSLSVKSVAVAVVFSMGIGVFFGFYPANKAAKLDPIEALRYE